MAINIPPVVSESKGSDRHRPDRKDAMNASAAATINSTELRDLLHSAAPPRVLDVRTPGEFQTAHIAGAYNVPLDLLREHRDEIIEHLDQDVVLVCRSGQRAAQAEQTLRTAGLINVHILEGGITAWEAKGFAVNRGAAALGPGTAGSLRGGADRSRERPG